MGQAVSPTRDAKRRADLARGRRERIAYILVHAAVGGAFMYLLQVHAFQATRATSLTLAIVFGLAAAGLAWHQTNR